MERDLAEVARHTDAAVTRARAELVRAVRQASAQGMPQTQIARSIGRSQPEVSRLLRFRGTSSLARNLRRNASQIREMVAAVGGSKVRVFGSVATGKERTDSDVDLLFDMQEPLSLLELGRVEDAISRLLGVSVDLVPESSLRPELRGRILAQAVQL